MQRATSAIGIATAVTMVGTWARNVEDRTRADNYLHFGNYMPTVNKLRDCPALLTLRILSGKWKTRILWSLRSSTKRFGQLRRELPDASSKVLAAQLRELEAAGIIDRTVYKEGAVRVVDYAYTPFGRSLVPALDALGEWGLKNFDRLRRANRAK
jgi:DNA-binding HxlR family transcriptional regulator